MKKVDTSPLADLNNLRQSLGQHSKAQLLLNKAKMNRGANRQKHIDKAEALVARASVKLSAAQDRVFKPLQTPVGQRESLYRTSGPSPVYRNKTEPEAKPQRHSDASQNDTAPVKRGFFARLFAVLGFRRA